MDWLKDVNKRLAETRDQKFRKATEGSIAKSNASWSRARSTLTCFLLYTPGIEHMKKYDKAYSNHKYLPSFVYHIRYKIGYDLDKIQKHVKKNFGTDINQADAITLYRLYPWLTDQKSKFMVFEAAQDLIDYVGFFDNGRVIKTDQEARKLNNLLGFYMEKYERKTMDEFKNHPDRIGDVNEVQLNTIDDVVKMRDLDIELKELKKLKGIKRYTETVIEVNEFGNVKQFPSKMEALTYLSKYITKAGYVVKADRITQIVKDGYIAIYKNAGAGAGSGSKIKVDAFPGLIIKVVYVDNGYKIKHITYKRSSPKEQNTIKRIDKYIAEGKLIIKDTYLKQR